MKNIRSFISINLAIIFTFATIYHRVQGFNKKLSFQDAIRQ